MSKTSVIPKFIGTISLGLLTGISYNLSTIVYPSTLQLPSATDASRVFSRIHAISQLHTVVLGCISVATFTGTYIASSKRFKHPYLLWTSLFASAAIGRDVYLLIKSLVIGGLSFSFLRDNTHRNVVKRMDNHGHGHGHKNDNHDHHKQELEELGLNGEMVEKRVKQLRIMECVKCVLSGVAFSLGVVGIWGDGA